MADERVKKEGGCRGVAEQIVSIMCRYEESWKQENADQDQLGAEVQDLLPKILALLEEDAKKFRVVLQMEIGRWAGEEGEVRAEN